jgi:tRNA dimethylallyltransferase
MSQDARNRARKLVSDDIIAARKLLPSDFNATDSQRVARALEVFLETGRHLSEFQKQPRIGAVAPDAFRVLISPDVNVSRERIAMRIPQMLSGGAVIEAQNIIKFNLNENRAIGAMQLCAYLRGEKSREDCVVDWINKTNQYAKRQRTWFRTQFKSDIIINRTGDDADIGLFL